eukprot:s5966_g1.t1
MAVPKQETPRKSREGSELTQVGTGDKEPERSDPNAEISDSVRDAPLKDRRLSKFVGSEAKRGDPVRAAPQADIKVLVQIWHLKGTELPSSAISKGSMGGPGLAKLWVNVGEPSAASLKRDDTHPACEWPRNSKEDPSCTPPSIDGADSIAQFPKRGIVDPSFNGDRRSGKGPGVVKSHAGSRKPNRWTRDLVDGAEPDVAMSEAKSAGPDSADPSAEGVEANRTRPYTGRLLPAWARDRGEVGGPELETSSTNGASPTLAKPREKSGDPSATGSVADGGSPNMLLPRIGTRLPQQAQPCEDGDNPDPATSSAEGAESEQAAPLGGSDRFSCTVKMATTQILPRQVRKVPSPSKQHPLAAATGSVARNRRQEEEDLT